jgi:hypothetical protein
MRIRLLALTAFATLAAAGPASATVVNDPDEPAVAAADDIEWAGVSRQFVAGTGWLYTHTIKTRAPYTRRPCVRIKVPNTPPLIRVCTTRMRPNAEPVTMKTSADSVSYTFNSLAIGNPSRYYWYATSGAPVADFAPDQGYSRFPPPPRLEEPELAVQPIFEWQPFMDPGGDW